MLKTTVGIERERFIVSRANNKVVPAIGTLLPKIHMMAEQRGVHSCLFDYELFAGQIEDRTLPFNSLSALKEALMESDALMNEVASQDNLKFDFSEFIDENQISVLQVNPFNQRHKSIWQSLSLERKLAASRVAGVHVHLAATEESTVKLLNVCRKETIERLIKIGDHSDGKRMNAYTTMSQTNGIPPTFSNFQEVMKYIGEHGGEKNVWDLVRYKPSTKTVEFRMFGSTESVDEVIGYVKVCLGLMD